MAVSCCRETLTLKVNIKSRLLIHFGLLVDVKCRYRSDSLWKLSTITEQRPAKGDIVFETSQCYESVRSVIHQILIHPSSFVFPYTTRKTAQDAFRLSEYGPVINLRKCVFGVSCIEYLGYTSTIKTRVSNIASGRSCWIYSWIQPAADSKGTSPLFGNNQFFFRVLLKRQRRCRHHHINLQLVQSELTNHSSAEPPNLSILFENAKSLAETMLL